MSRIEEALEKAAKLRSERLTSGQETNPDMSRLHLAPEPAVKKINVTNQLLVAANDPNTPAAEEYRKLKSNIVKHTKGDHFRNMLMVSSAVGSEGKSITALNLAMSLAMEYDHTVMLIDADLRKPSIHGYLGIKSKTGLAECLLDGLDVKDALIKTGIGRLSLLTSGRAVSNPAEIFSSQRARDFFMEIKTRYHDRYVIIDTSPVLPFAETRSLCAFVDGIVLVVKEGGVSLGNLKETIDCLKGPEMMGIVYNQAEKMDLNKHSMYYRYAPA